MQNHPIYHNLSRTGMAVNYNGQLHVWDNGQPFEAIQIPHQQYAAQPVDRPRHNPYDTNMAAPQGYPQPQHGAAMGSQYNYGNPPPNMAPAAYPDPHVAQMHHVPVEGPSVQAKSSGHSLSAYFAEDEDSIIAPADNTESFEPVPIHSKNNNSQSISRLFEDSIGLTHMDLDDSELEALALDAAEQDYNEELNMNAEDHVYGLRERRLAEERITDGITPLPVPDTAPVEEPVAIVWSDDDDDFTYNEVISSAEDETVVLSSNSNRNLLHVDAEDLLPAHNTVQHEPVETNPTIVFLDEDEEDMIGTIRKPDEVPVADIAAAVDRINNATTADVKDVFTMADDDDDDLVAAEVDEIMTPAESMSKLSSEESVSLFLAEINEDVALKSVSVVDTLTSNIAIETIIDGDNNAFNIIAALDVCAKSEEFNPYAIIKYETLSKLVSPEAPIASIYNTDEILRITKAPVGELENILWARAYEYYLTYVSHSNDSSLDKSQACFHKTLSGWLQDTNSKHYFAIFNIMAGGTNESRFNDNDDWIITATLPRCAIVLNLMATAAISSDVTLEQIVVSALRDMSAYTEILNEEFGSARDSNGELLTELTESDSSQYMPCVASHLTHVHGAQVIIKTTDNVIGLYTYYEWEDGRGTLSLQTTF